MYKTVLGVHDGCLRILVRVGLYVGCSLVAYGEYLVGMGGGALYQLLGVRVALKQLDGEVAC